MENRRNDIEVRQVEPADSFDYKDPRFWLAIALFAGFLAFLIFGA